MFDLTGKVALITGATGGIGVAIAKKMKEAGATVVVSGRNVAKMNAEFGDEFVKMPADLAADGGAEELIMNTIDTCGKID
ncbi:MAG: SDR family NAD(P)-dependent oxidoreductase, partial [Alphaproteobacteria bacterium]|nr:SDR family NAD(P)-dependent oxidoreductase [Alphaproteobacteria bacterium]